MINKQKTVFLIAISKKIFNLKLNGECDQKCLLRKCLLRKFILRKWLLRHWNSPKLRRKRKLRANLKLRIKPQLWITKILNLTILYLFGISNWFWTGSLRAIQIGILSFFIFSLRFTSQFTRLLELFAFSAI